MFEGYEFMSKSGTITGENRKVYVIYVTEKSK